jgi:hypothetical protein
MSTHSGRRMNIKLVSAAVTVLTVGTLGLADAG